jgi:enoyl-CoA hydratase/carnithine racemase
MFSGRTVTGREAVALGLANECVPDAELEARTLALAREIATNSWFTLRTEKALLRGGAGLPPAQAIAYERANSPGAGPDMAERLKSFGAKK